MTDAPGPLPRPPPRRRRDGPSCNSGGFDQPPTATTRSDSTTGARMLAPPPRRRRDGPSCNSVTISGQIRENTRKTAFSDSNCKSIVKSSPAPLFSPPRSATAACVRGNEHDLSMFHSQDRTIWHEWHNLARVGTNGTSGTNLKRQSNTAENRRKRNKTSRVGTSGTNGTSWVRSYQLPVGPNPCPASRHPIHHPQAIIFRPFGSLPKSSTMQTKQWSKQLSPLRFIRRLQGFRHRGCLHYRYCMFCNNSFRAFSRRSF